MTNPPQPTPADSARAAAGVQEVVMQIVEAMGPITTKARRIEVMREMLPSLLTQTTAAHEEQLAKVRAERDENAGLRQIVQALSDLEMNDEVCWMGTRCMANMNDMFFWALAEPEEITVEDLPELRRAHADSKHYNGTLLWCCRKRGMRPRGAVYAYLHEDEWPLFDACGPERLSGFGNPVGTERRVEYKAQQDAEKRTQASLRTSLTQRTAELAQVHAELEREKGRLDWLEKNSSLEFPVSPWAEWPWETSLRAAIDQAIARTSDTPGE